jgi:hypothetical protein
VQGEVTVSGNRSYVRDGNSRRRCDGCNGRGGSRLIGSAVGHRISGAQGDFNPGMRNVHQHVSAVDIVHVHRIGVQPRGRPRISETEPESAELEAGLTANHSRLADVKLMVTSEAGTEAIVRNVPPSMEIFAAAVIGSVPETAVISACISVRAVFTAVRYSTMTVTTCLRTSLSGPRVARAGGVGAFRNLAGPCSRGQCWASLQRAGWRRPLDG